MKSYKDKDRGKDKHENKKNIHSSAVFIGRFQPFHSGHLSVLHAIAKLGYCQIIIGIGSSQYSQVKENPFTFEERKQMIEHVLEAQSKTLATHPTIKIIALPDIHDDANWVQHVNDLIHQAGYQYDTVFSANPNVKDLFMQSGQSVQTCPQTINVSATQIRQWIIDKSTEWQQYVDPMIQNSVEQGVEKYGNDQSSHN